MFLSPGGSDVQADPAADLHYGIVRPAESPTGRTFRCSDLVEKPAPAHAPSRLAAIGRYVLTPAVFDLLERSVPGAGGEIQLTDALAALAKSGPLYAHRIEGRHFDVGQPAGFVHATLAWALERPDMRDEVIRLLTDELALHASVLHRTEAAAIDPADRG